MANAENVNITTTGFVDAAKTKNVEEYDITLSYTYTKNGQSKEKEITTTLSKLIEDGFDLFPEIAQDALFQAVNIIARRVYGIDD